MYHSKTFRYFFPGIFFQWLVISFIKKWTSVVFYADQLAHLLVQETMAIEKFVFRENWVGIKVTGLKTILLAIFDATWTHSLASKDPTKEFLKEHFSQEKQKLCYYQFCDFKTYYLTKVKLQKINNQFFTIFDRNREKIWP